VTDFSFTAASSRLPDPVREFLSADVRAWRAGDHSALDLPFTDGEFVGVLDAAEEELRALLGVPEDYRVLFLQGGATTQFTMVPMNLAQDGRACDYVLTGHWSRRAAEAARAWCDVRIIASGTAERLPEPSSWSQTPDAAYCHMTSNETAEGLQFHTYPSASGAPLIVDMTADFLTRPLSIRNFGMIYASAQKNLGAAGLTIVIVRENILGRARRGTPAPFDYARQAGSGSRVNTPPTFAVVVALRMLGWLREQGGLEAAAARGRTRSAALYEVIDEDDFYRCAAAPPCRSLVSVCFHMHQPALDRLFIEEACANGLRHLQGHPSVGGVRASLYNTVTDEAVAALAEFMIEFRRRRG